MHTFRITERIFILYHISSYNKPYIKEIDACVSFDDSGDYSKKAKELIKKYNLNVNAKEVISNTHEEFCVNLYMSQKHVHSEGKYEFKPAVKKHLEEIFNKYSYKKIKEIKERAKNG